MTKSTLSGNSAPKGDGIANGGGTVYLSGTILDTGANGTKAARNNNFYMVPFVTVCNVIKL